MFNFPGKYVIEEQPKIDGNTFLLWEPCSINHAEVVPGFTKYLLDLGYSVSVMVEPERIDDGLFSLFSENERVYLNRMTGKNARKFLLKNGLTGIQDYRYRQRNSARPAQRTAPIFPCYGTP